MKRGRSTSPLVHGRVLLRCGLRLRVPAPRVRRDRGPRFSLWPISQWRFLLVGTRPHLGRITLVPPAEARKTKAALLTARRPSRSSTAAHVSGQPAGRTYRWAAPGEQAHGDAERDHRVRDDGAQYRSEEKGRAQIERCHLTSFVSASPAFLRTANSRSSPQPRTARSVRLGVPRHVARALERRLLGSFGDSFVDFAEEDFVACDPLYPCRCHDLPRRAPGRALPALDEGIAS